MKDPLLLNPAATANYLSSGYQPRPFRLLVLALEPAAHGDLPQNDFYDAAFLTKGINRVRRSYRRLRQQRRTRRVVLTGSGEPHAGISLGRWNRQALSPVTTSAKLRWSMRCLCRIYATYHGGRYERAASSVVGCDEVDTHGLMVTVRRGLCDRVCAGYHSN